MNFHFRNIFIKFSDMMLVYMSSAKLFFFLMILIRIILGKLS